MIVDQHHPEVDVSIVVTCKGRLHHLQQTLPLMIGQVGEMRHEIVVVDYGCPQGAFHWCKIQNWFGVKSLRVKDNNAVFNASRARNCGAFYTSGAILAFVDADIKLTPGWLDTASEAIRTGQSVLTRVHRTKRGTDLYGTNVVKKEVYEKVRGYDESLSGWGPEDFDFYERCEQHGKISYFSDQLLTPIRHGNQERTRYRQDNDIKTSTRLNTVYLKERKGRVNPEGFGTTDCGIHDGAFPFKGHIEIEDKPRIPLCKVRR